MPCFHLEKGARFLRMENLKNRSATGIAGRCDWAERHKRRLPLFLQSLRNGAGHPRTEASPQGSPPHNEKSRVQYGPGQFHLPLRGRFTPSHLAFSSSVGGFHTLGGIPGLPDENRRHRGNNRLNRIQSFTWSSWGRQDPQKDSDLPSQSPCHRVPHGTLRLVQRSADLTSYRHGTQRWTHP